MVWQPVCEATWRPETLQPGTVLFLQEGDNRQQIVLILEERPVCCPRSESDPCLISHAKVLYRRFCAKTRLVIFDETQHAVQACTYPHITLSEPLGLSPSIIVGRYLEVGASPNMAAVEYTYRVCKSFCLYPSVESLVEQHQPWLWRLSAQLYGRTINIQKISLGVQPYSRILTGTEPDPWEDITESVGYPLLRSA